MQELIKSNNDACDNYLLTQDKHYIITKCYKSKLFYTCLWKI